MSFNKVFVFRLISLISFAIFIFELLVRGEYWSKYFVVSPNLLLLFLSSLVITVFVPLGFLHKNLRMVSWALLTLLVILPLTWLGIVDLADAHWSQVCVPGPGLATDHQGVVNKSYDYINLHIQHRFCPLEYSYDFY